MSKSRIHTHKQAYKQAELPITVPVRLEPDWEKIRKKPQIRKVKKTQDPKIFLHPMTKVNKN